MLLGDFCKLIEGLQVERLSLCSFADGCTFETFWEKDPVDLPIPLNSPKRMFLARQLALHVEPSGTFTPEQKAKWQRYWLRCCLRSECNYIFNVLKECNVNREVDVRNLARELLLWQEIKSDEGKNYYKRAMVDWLLKEI